MDIKWIIIKQLNVCKINVFKVSKLWLSTRKTLKNQLPLLCVGCASSPPSLPRFVQRKTDRRPPLALSSYYQPSLAVRLRTARSFSRYRSFSRLSVGLEL
eukprot:Selendium_serpulae@DN8496_c0_g1_i1.p1